MPEPELPSREERHHKDDIEGEITLRGHPSTHTRAATQLDNWGR